MEYMLKIALGFPDCGKSFILSKKEQVEADVSYCKTEEYNICMKITLKVFFSLVTSYTLFAPNTARKAGFWSDVKDILAVVYNV